jgi:hypothetical protein
MKGDNNSQFMYITDFIIFNSVSWEIQLWGNNSEEMKNYRLSNDIKMITDIHKTIATE